MAPMEATWSDTLYIVAILPKNQLANWHQCFPFTKLLVELRIAYYNPWCIPAALKRKLIWHRIWKYAIPKGNFIFFQPLIVRGFVSFREGKFNGISPTKIKTILGVQSFWSISISDPPTDLWKVLTFRVLIFLTFKIYHLRVCSSSFNLPIHRISLAYKQITPKLKSSSCQSLMCLRTHFGHCHWGNRQSS